MGQESGRCEACAVPAWCLSSTALCWLAAGGLQLAGVAGLGAVRRSARAARRAPNVVLLVTVP